MLTWRLNGSWKKKVLNVELSSNYFFKLTIDHNGLVYCKTEWYRPLPVVFPSEWREAVSSKWTAISCWIIAVEQRFQNLSQIIVRVLLALSSSSLTDGPTLGSPYPSTWFPWLRDCSGKWRLPEPAPGGEEWGTCKYLSAHSVRQFSKCSPHLAASLSICWKYLLYEKDSFRLGLLPAGCAVK